MRIGLEAPGVDWHSSSMAQIRLDGANLSRTTLLKARFDGATWTDGRVCADESIGECK